MVYVSINGHGQKHGNDGNGYKKKSYTVVVSYFIFLYFFSFLSISVLDSDSWTSLICTKVRNVPIELLGHGVDMDTRYFNEWLQYIKQYSDIPLLRSLRWRLYVDVHGHEIHCFRVQSKLGSDFKM